jgi:hypothetical protein
MGYPRLHGPPADANLPRNVRDLVEEPVWRETCLLKGALWESTDNQEFVLIDLS